MTSTASSVAPPGPFAPLAIFPVGPKFRERQPTRLADALGVDSDSVGPLRMATANPPTVLSAVEVG